MTPDGAALLDYHRQTALRPGEAWLAVEPWNRPRPFKLYEDLESLRLPPVPSAEAHGPEPAGEPPIDAPMLASLPHWSAGITRRRRLPDGTVMPFRAASCTGALYHIETYAVCAELPGLPAGVYHYALQNETARRLRPGDWRASLLAAGGADAGLAAAPLALVLSSEFWRNAWRYGERAYRHAFWDAGTILANLLALGGAYGLPTRVITAFDDAAVNVLLGLDGVGEAALAVVALGGGAPILPTTTPPEPIAPRVAPSSPRPRTPPAIAAAHVASSLAGSEHVVSWRAAAAAFNAAGAPQAEPAVSEGGLSSLPAVSACSDPVEAIIVRRGSARRFSEESISVEALAAVCRAAAAVPGGDAWPAGAPLAETLLVVQAAAGIAPGVYRLRGETTLELLAAGERRNQVASLVPDARRAGAAAVTIWWLADGERVLSRLGGRGYRVVQLDAGLALGRLYLAATAAGLGATGLTFFDDEAAGFFASWSPRRQVVLAAAVGRTAPRSTPAG